MICDYCKKDPGMKKGTIVWRGFRDADTGQHVCFACSNLHYVKKTNQSTVPGMCTYSELPVVIATVQLKFTLI